MKQIYLLLILLFIFGCGNRSDDSSSTVTAAKLQLVTRGIDLKCSSSINSERTAPGQVTARIYNGSTLASSDAMVKSLVKLKMTYKNNNEEFICTGTIIGLKTILTAAHCFTDKAKDLSLANLYALKISYGLDLGDTETITNISKIRLGSGFIEKNFKGANIIFSDFAVINLDKAIPSGFAPASVLNATIPLKSILASGNGLLIAGYGMIDSEDKYSVGVLRKGKSIFDHLEASAKLIITNEEVSANGTCPGDSGGPLFIKKQNGALVLIGVTSSGTGDATKGAGCGGLSLYTNAQDFSAEIQKFMSESLTYESALTKVNSSLNYCTL